MRFSVVVAITMEMVVWSCFFISCLIILFYFTLFLLVAVLAKRNPRIFSRLVWEVTCDIAMLSRGNLSLLFHGLFD